MVFAIDSIPEPEKFITAMAAMNFLLVQPDNVHCKMGNILTQVLSGCFLKKFNSSREKNIILKMYMLVEITFKSLQCCKA